MDAQVELERQEPAQESWFALCFSLLTRTRDNLRIAPQFFLRCAAVCYLPIIAFEIVRPIGDAMLSLDILLSLFAGALVIDSAIGWYAVGEIGQGGTPTIAGAMQALRPKMIALGLTAAIGVILEFLGLVAIAPGVLTFMWVFMSGPIACEEKLKGWPAIDRARRFLEDFRWSEVGLIMLIAFTARSFAGLIPRLLTNLVHGFASDTPTVVEWIFRAYFWAVDIAILAFLSVWVCIAYRDIAGLLKQQEEFARIAAGSGEAAKAAAAQLAKLRNISLKKFAPTPKVIKILTRVAELAMMAAIGFLAYLTLKPPALFEHPPSTVVFSKLRIENNHLLGHVQNGAGIKIRKATWCVQLPHGTPGAPPTLIINALPDNEGRDFDIPLPIKLDQVPPIQPYKIEWAE